MIVATYIIFSYLYFGWLATMHELGLVSVILAPIVFPFYLYSFFKQ